MIFMVMGAVSASESINVQHTEDSNLMEGNDDSLSTINKLEVSNEDSISQTNIVYSHEDDLGNYPVEDNNLSTCEDNREIQSASNDFEADEGNNTLSLSGSSTDSVVAASSSNDSVSAASSTDGVVSASVKKVSTKLTVDNTHHGKSATYFILTLKDNAGKALKNQKVTLKVKNKVYSGVTNKNGQASIKTDALAVGTYTVSLSYAGNTNYSSSSVSKKVKVLSSVVGSDVSKYYGTETQYKATFWKNNYALANTKVSFTLNGKKYTRTTNKDGVAKINLKLAVGKYVVTATNPYNNEKVSNNIVVKKDKTEIFSRYTKTYVAPDKKNSLMVALKSKHDVPIDNVKVYFKFNNKKVTVMTDENGKAVFTIPALSKGTYSISFNYKGDRNYQASSGETELIVKNPTTKLSSSSLKMKYNDGSKFKVKLTTASGKVMANETIKFTVKGKVIFAQTNSKGIAQIAIKNLKPGNHKIFYSFDNRGSKSYTSGVNVVKVTKNTAVVSAKNLVMKYKDGSAYKVVVKDKSGNPIKGAYVKSVINGKTYIYETNAEGIAKLKLTQPIGYYPITTTLSDRGYDANTVSKKVLVNGTKFVADDLHVSVGDKFSYSVKAIDGKKNPIKNSPIKFTFKGKSYTAKTNAKGIAKINLGAVSKGNHAIKFAHESFTGSSKIYVVGKLSIKNIVTASKNVKKYIDKHKKLPSNFKIGDARFTHAQYLYLVSKAIINLKAGKKDDIKFKDVKNPKKPKNTENLGNIVNYKSVAKSIIKTANSEGIMPNSVKSDVGTIGYKNLVFAFSEVMTSYGKDGKLPSYANIKSISGSSSKTTGILNSKNTISNLAAYLSASLHCQVNDAKIKKLVSKLIKGCKSDKEKASVIFNYVRDTCSYSFYYDTKYGAVGTLNAKTGNCVDHSHLLVAMFRTAGLAARYAHGTCTFSSGSTFGHVWTQVLIGDTWTVADATSSRNSLGKVANWNAYSYKLHSYSSAIAF